MTDRAARAKAAWLRERPDIDANAITLVGQMLDAVQILERNWLFPLAARFELHPGEFDVIATLQRAGAPHALTPTELYESLMISSGAMTSRLDRLERKGLIARAPAPTDRRSVLVKLTPAGLALIDKVLPLYVANEQQALSSLDTREQAQLGELLGKLIAGLHKAPSP